MCLQKYAELRNSIQFIYPLFNYDVCNHVLYSLFALWNFLINSLQLREHKVGRKYGSVNFDLWLRYAKFIFGDLAICKWKQKYPTGVSRIFESKCQLEGDVKTNQVEVKYKRR